MRAFVASAARSRARRAIVHTAVRRAVRASCTPALSIETTRSNGCCVTDRRVGGVRAFASGVAPARGTFVSQYYEMEDAQEIGEFLARKRLAFRQTETHYIVRECPFCHPTHGKTDNLFKLYVEKHKGVFICHRCGAAGSWFDFKHKLAGDNVAIGSAEHALRGSETTEVKVIAALDNQKAMAIQQNLLDEPAFAPVLQYLTETRGIHKDVLQKYCVGAVEQPFRNDCGELEPVACISFPWMARKCDLDAMGVVYDDASSTVATDDKNSFDVIRLKIRSVDDKSKQRLVPKGGSWGLFGWNTVPTAAEEVVLTEGEFDAMAVYQATGLPAVSLPNGCQSLPPSVLPLLERFKKIYLWMDNDAAGQANVSKFAAKIGMSRCYIVRALPDVNVKPAKDANDALLAGHDLKKLIAKAERIPHSQIATFDQLRREVYDEIVNPMRACGVQSRSLPSLNRLLKGHRMGEVTVLTGPTGCGKTTLLSQLSLDLCGQGVSTLWGSFEIKNTRLIHKMLTQMAGKSLQGNVKEFEAVADKFEALPMYFLRFFGSTEVDEVLDAMEYAVYAHDVQHILLDNVQFMMAGQGRGFDKFERQDAALDKFRRFASQKNVHLTLVIHPRKEQEDIDLNLSSVFGTAKATQEADNVLILQRTRGESRLDVRKNRFDGTLGTVPLVFDFDSNSLRESREEMMPEDLSSIDMEAEMMLQQKQRQRKADKIQESQAQPTMEVERKLEEEAAFMRDYEFTSGQGVNGHRNGSSGINGVRNGFHAASPPSDSPSSAPTPAKPESKPTGGSPRRSPPGGEPFSAFTPIITR